LLVRVPCRVTGPEPGRWSPQRHLARLAARISRRPPPLVRQPCGLLV